MKKKINSDGVIYYNGTWRTSDDSSLKSRWYSNVDDRNNRYYRRLANTKNCDIEEGTGSYGINLFKTKNRNEGSPIRVVDLDVVTTKSKSSSNSYAKWWANNVCDKGYAADMRRGCGGDYSYFKIR